MSSATTVRKARASHRYEISSLTYVTLDHANGGIVRNLNSGGAGIQAVAALPAGEKVRLRFELQNPRVRLEIQAQVVWSQRSGQCGVRFLDISPANARRINEWIFGGLLERAARRPPHADFALNAAEPLASYEEDGIIISSARRQTIEIKDRDLPQPQRDGEERNLEFLRLVDEAREGTFAFDWFTLPLSGHALRWFADGLVVLTGVMIFLLVFLSVARSLPQWPFVIGILFAAALCVAVLYGGLIYFMGLPSAGTVLARISAEQEHLPPKDDDDME